MVRFSCFAHIHRHKPKKAMECVSQDQVRKDVSNSKSSTSSLLRRNDAQAAETNKPSGSTSLGRGWKSEEIKGKVDFEHDPETHQMRHLKKSQSLGDVLYLDGRAAMENDADDDLDSPEQKVSVAADGSRFIEGSPSSLYQKVPHSVSVHISSDHVNNGSIYSVGDPHDLEKESRRSDSSLTGDRANGSINRTPRTSPVIVKSNSVPNICDSVPVSGRSSPFKYLALQSRSSDDLRVLDMRQKEKSVLEVHTEARQEQEQDDGIYKFENNDVENVMDNGYDGYGHSSLTKDWIVPVTEEVNTRKLSQGVLSVQRLDEMPSKDFKIKRIEEWVNDLQHCSMFEEANLVAEYDDEVHRESPVLNGSAAAKGDVKLTPGMEATKKYISSLSASATAAQLVNHGLVAIPFLSAFVSLRVLNISGNAIVRITAGALPRGLHVLNLSKNSISTIEGLRELTRLRVLDLSYNRIIRIGHGLASCSSLKELYLAGNKISEVEGLHRLLKLTVLDLRFNKISTAKCLGQLAANYNSLQAISLEGNPAQKNVGDEQLKKYLLGLLPHLAYFNRQAIKTSSLKDAADRSVRLGMSSHQLERGLRTDLKGTRKGTHGAAAAAAAHKPSSSAANHSRRIQATATQKRSKDRSGRLPPSGTKGTMNHQNPYVEVGNRVLNLRSELSMRRSRSEGTLGAF